MIKEELVITAKKYRDAGLSVIPLNNKKPAMGSTKKYQTIKATDEEIEKLFSASNANGIAIFGGAVSENLVVFDVDTKNDPSALLWTKFEEQLKDQIPNILSQLVIEQTISGGIHLYARCTTTFSTRKLAQIQNEVNKKPKELIGLQGEKTYVAASPTQGYRIIQGDLCSIPEITIDDVNQIISIAKNLDQYKNEYQKLLEIRTEEDLKIKIKSKPESIFSGLRINDTDLQYQASSISVIAAATGHGKSTILTHSALEVAKQKTVHFFSYEEDWHKVRIRALNAYLGKELFAPLSMDSKRALLSYYSHGATNYMKDFDKRDVEILGLIDEFNKKYIDSGKLKIHYVNYKIEELADAIKFVKQHDDVGAVFVDYIQWIAPKKAKKIRQEEMKQVCSILNQVAIETGLPIVVAAQFNRSVTSKQSLHPTNLSEAGDIERIASLIIGVWNNNCPSKQGNSNTNQEDTVEPNTLYVQVLKNREGEISGMNGTWGFDGNQSLIIMDQNTKSKVAKKDSVWK